ncbi:MAG: BON domain-containing protein [Alphaproteobacteria bacterium]|nr:BON domain-containing protein [Alphaproteobacteria bacterium]
MRQTLISTLMVIPLLLGAGTLASCSAPAVVGGAATSVALAAAQERSLGTIIDDTTIRIQINHLLLQASEKLFLAVDLEVVEGRVLLHGTVSAPDDRVEATRLAWQAQGVKEVLNELQVTDRGGVIDYAKDTWIGAQLRAKLLGDGNVADINFNVVVVNSTVYIMGVARSQTELERVTNHARTIRGVEKVVSYVRVKSDPKLSS